jgi:hypothetical protein
MTFWAPDAPTNRVQPYEDEPDYFENRSVLPEIGLSNSNATRMLDLMGLDSTGYCGRVELADFDPVIERLTNLVNREEARKPGLLEPSVHQSRRFVKEGNRLRMVTGPTIYMGGRDDEYIVRVATRLLELFVAARREGYAVSWGSGHGTPVARNPKTWADPHELRHLTRHDSQGRPARVRRPGSGLAPVLGRRGACSRWRGAGGRQH